MMATRKSPQVNSIAWHRKLTTMIIAIGLVSLLNIGRHSMATSQIQQAEALIQAFVGLHLVSAQTELTSVLLQLRELMLKKQEGTITTVGFILRLSELSKKLDEIKDRYRLTELGEALGKISLQRMAESIFVPSKQRVAIQWTLHSKIVDNFIQAYFDLQLAINSAQLDKLEIADLRCDLADLRLEIASLAQDLLSVIGLQKQ